MKCINIQIFLDGMYKLCNTVRKWFKTCFFMENEIRLVQKMCYEKR